MKTIRPFTFTALATAVILQVSCTATEPKKAEPPPPQEKTVVVQPEEQLSARELTRRAIERFQEGEAQPAEQDLRQALTQKPRYSFAKRLLEQFEKDPQAYLGEEHFAYQVKSGESLSMIAERFLGDKLQFIILARYNQLSKPGRLDAGQTLRIPQRYKPAPSAPVQEEPVATSPEPAAPVAEQAPAEPAAPPKEVAAAPKTYDEAKKLFDRGAFADAIERIEQDLAPGDASDPQLTRLLMDAYGAYAGKLIGQQRWQEARDILREAGATDPANESIPQQLAYVEDKIEGRRLHAIGREQEAQGELEKAFTAYSDAAVYDKDNRQYDQDAKRVGKKLANQYHRLALDSYRKEQLDAAKRHWEKVLKVDPENRIAPGYLAKVEEIQQKIREIDAK
jgi:tetratricopeptide (TPR) repeat protein